MLIRKLSQKEIDTITDYRKEYGDYDQADTPGPFMPTKEWLTEWEKGKESEIANIFGGELYYEFPIEYHATKQVLEERLDDFGVPNHSFMKALYDFIWDHFNGSTRSKLLSDIYGEAALLGKTYKSSESTVINYTTSSGEEKHFVITKGMKLTKVFAKFNNIYHLVEPEVYEDFRQKYSLVFNTATIKGTYVLSIRPFDYMTMSDNDYNWSSCMSWRNGGCYRRGTIEMMTSPYVVVGYLKGDKPMSECPEIDNKKWRCLFIVNPSIITSVKNYPFYNDELTTFGVKKLKELAEKNLGRKYQDEMKISENGSFNFCYDEKEYGLRFGTDFMYNDFGTDEAYHHYFMSEKMDEEIIKSFTSSRYNNRINYSGRYICTICGDYETVDDYEDSEGLYLCCIHCSGSICCERCGRRIYPNEDSYSTIDYQCVCSNCIDDYIWISYLDNYVNYEEVNKYRLAIPAEGEDGYYLSSFNIEVVDDDWNDALNEFGSNKFDNHIIPSIDWEADFLVVDPVDLIKNWAEVKRYFVGYPYRMSGEDAVSAFIKFYQPE